jgi:hypothetical protein
VLFSGAGATGAKQAEAADLRRANEELAGNLAEMTHLQDESAAWARGGATMARANSNRYVVLEEAVSAAVELI